MNFGETFIHETNIEKLINLEEKKEKSSLFLDLDSLVQNIIENSISAKSIAEIKTKNKIDTLIFSKEVAPGLKVLERFSIEQQQSKGAWYFPEKAILNIGEYSLPYYYSEVGKLGSGLSFEIKSSFTLDTPENLISWCLFNEIFSKLFMPIKLRSTLNGRYNREKQIKLWTEVETFFNSINLNLRTIDKMRYGCGWSRLKSDEQYQTKLDYLLELKDKLPEDIAQRIRIYRIKKLTHQFYNKKKNNPSVLAKQVLIKKLQPILSAYFGGDWLQYIEYIEETPHSQEKIITSLPEVNVSLKKSSELQEVAKKLNIDVSKLASIIGSNNHDINKKIDVIKDFWSFFDKLHTKQQVGQPSLWGIESQSYFQIEDHNTAFDSTQHQTVYPQELLYKIQQYWGSIMLNRWPESIVSEPFPLERMIKAIGAAFDFWHGCGLTAWFICEGPYSRTDIQGMEEYYKKKLSYLDELGTPIDRSLFKDLKRIERTKLGPIEHEMEVVGEHDFGGITITTSMSHAGSTRKGFEFLRDTVTQYRRKWAEQYLLNVCGFELV